MDADRLQLQRLELKYLVSERTAAGVRDFVQSYLEIDEFGMGQPNSSYAIHSLYLDSDQLTTYGDTLNSNKNRFKLRLRYYDERPASPVFFEIKRRMNDAIMKKRGGVKRDAVDELLAGQLPALEHLVSPVPKQLLALRSFSQLMLQLQARPKAHVCYLREAWVSTQDNSIRVTMDRAVRIAYEPTTRLSTVIEDFVTPFDPLVILELKFTGRFPNWFNELVQAFGLVRASASKYAEGVAGIGEGVFRFHAPDGKAPARPRSVPRQSAVDSVPPLGIKASS